MPEIVTKIKSPVKVVIKKIIEMNGAIVSINNPIGFLTPHPAIRPALA
jgi:hypothetical protein